MRFSDVMVNEIMSTLRDLAMREWVRGRSTVLPKSEQREAVVHLLDTRDWTEPTDFGETYDDGDPLWKEKDVAAFAHFLCEAPFNKHGRGGRATFNALRQRGRLIKEWLNRDAIDKLATIGARLEKIA